jgi:RNAse (barnase) inhibitor barstar
MSIENKVKQAIDQYKSFKGLNLGSMLSGDQTYADFEGANVEETKNTYDYIVNTLDLFIENQNYKQLSFTAVNSLFSQLPGLHAACSTWISNRDQGSFQNASSAIDSFRYHLQLFGITYLNLGGAQIEQTKNDIVAELVKIRSGNNDLDQLKKSVEALIEPSVAGSLSNAFSARKKSLMWGRIFWGALAVIVGFWSIDATHSLVKSVGEVFSSMSAAKTNLDALWPVVLIRTLILLPLYAAFGFCFSQYKKERDFEEEYAHKAAVATSLPNYGDLTRQPEVRDQIVTGATTVIFRSPTAANRRHDKNDLTVSSLKEFLDSLGALIKKKD